MGKGKQKDEPIEVAIKIYKPYIADTSVHPLKHVFVYHDTDGKTVIEYENGKRVRLTLP